MLCWRTCRLTKPRRWPSGWLIPERSGGISTTPPPLAPGSTWSRDGSNSSPTGGSAEEPSPVSMLSSRPLQCEPSARTTTPNPSYGTRPPTTPSPRSTETKPPPPTKPNPRHTTSSTSTGLPRGTKVVATDTEAAGLSVSAVTVDEVGPVTLGTTPDVVSESVGAAFPVQATNTTATATGHLLRPVDPPSIQGVIQVVQDRRIGLRLEHRHFEVGLERPLNVRIPQLQARFKACGKDEAERVITNFIERRHGTLPRGGYLARCRDRTISGVRYLVCTLLWPGRACGARASHAR